MKQFPFDLPAYRARTGLTQPALAKYFGVSTSVIWRAEKRGTVPKLWLWALAGLEPVLQAKEQEPVLQGQDLS